MKYHAGQYIVLYCLSRIYLLHFVTSKRIRIMTILRVKRRKMTDLTRRADCYAEKRVIGAIGSPLHVALLLLLL